MPMNLPTDLLRDFLAMVDTGSLTRATQMNRLEEAGRRQLFLRTGRTPVRRPASPVAEAGLPRRDAIRLREAAADH